MSKLLILIPILLLAILRSSAHAQTSLTFTPGWANHDRPGRWNPILVRASDPIPRNVTLQIISPQPGGFARIVEEHFAIGPTASTFQLLAPSHFSPGQQTVAVLRDGSTGGFLAQFPTSIQRPMPVPAQSGPPDATGSTIGPHAIFIGISGVPASLDQLDTDLNTSFAYRPPHLLPRSALGYDSLEILLLNRPRLANIDLDQQTAILDWVRGGGTLILTPGDDVPAANTPFANGLPCRFGEQLDVDLSGQSLNDKPLPPRFAHAPIRALDATAGSEPLQLFKNPAVSAITRRVGLGQILVLPFDIKMLQIDQPSDRLAVVPIWQMILKKLLPLPKPTSEAPRFAAPYYGFMSESPDQFREGAATATACDFLLPPVSPPRQWPHVALVLLGLFTIIGPLDFIVMKLAGYSPWTWTTMMGWIASAVLAAIYISSVAMRPTASLKTLRLIDQADEATIAATDLLALSPASTKAITLEPSPADSTSTNFAGWWEPALPGPVDPRDPTSSLDLSFHETDASCVPEPIPTAPARPRYLRRQNIQQASPAVHADLSLIGEGSSTKLVGTLQNRLPTPLKDIKIRTVLGVVSIPLDSPGTLAPGQQIAVNLPAAGEPFAPARFENRYQNFGYYGSRTDTAPVREEDLWAVVPDLVGRRSIRIDGLFESNAPIACIYAQSVNPSATAQVAGDQNLQTQQYQFLCALIPLARKPI